MPLLFDAITFDTSFSDVDPVTGDYDPPEAWVLYSLSDASATTPVWLDATAALRGDQGGFTTSRGRDNELDVINAGTATITLDNRDRAFDPVHNSGIRPLNRWWIRAQHGGVTYDIFKGYAEAYKQQWRAPVGQAETVVSCVDEFKVLSLDKLPVPSPPRDSYADVVKSDLPLAYWRFHDQENLSGDPGQNWLVPGDGGFDISNQTAIVGESGATAGSLMIAASGDKIENQPAQFDTQSATALTVEFWFNRLGSPPGSTAAFIIGRANAAGTTGDFNFQLTTTGAIQFNGTNTTPTLFTVTSAVLTEDTWYHVTGRIGSGTIAIYLNGAVSASTAWTGSLATVSDDVSSTLLPRIQSVGTDFLIDEFAFYPAHDIGAARIAAHYQAGRERGFVEGQTSSDRFHAVLDESSAAATPRQVVSSVRPMTGSFMRGQAPLDELRDVAVAELADGMVFAAKDGTLVLLGTGHRAVSPYNTVQATFDDDGTDLPYAAADLDYSEAFLINEFNLSRKNGSLVTNSDATSISQYFKRSRAITDLPVQADDSVTAIGTALLAKYKDPFTRILSITLTTDIAAVTAAALARDLGDRIQIIRRPPGGGSPINQTSFIQRIEVTAGTGGVPWTIRWGVSPL